MPDFPSTTSASDIWTLKDVEEAVRGSNWPLLYVSSGLTAFVNATDTSSYSGSGTTWTDLSGQSNNFTLSTASMYATSPYKTMNINGSTSRTISTTLTNQAPSNATLQTYNAWMVGNTWSAFGSNASGGGQFHFRVNSNATTLTLDYSNYGGGGASDNPVSASVTHLAVNNVCVVKTAAYYYDIYYNGTKVINQAYRNATSSTSLVFGTYYSGSPHSGDMSLFQMYNRALTASEVSQNFSAFRGLFGV